MRQESLNPISAMVFTGDFVLVVINVSSAESSLNYSIYYLFPIPVSFHEKKKRNKREEILAIQITRILKNIYCIFKIKVYCILCVVSQYQELDKNHQSARRVKYSALIQYL